MNKAASSSKQSWQQWLKWGVVGLLIYLPFHAMVSIALGHFVGFQTSFSLAKDGFVVLLIVGLIWLGVKEKDWRSWIMRPVNLVAIGIVVLTLIITLLISAPLPQLVYGVKANILPLILFVVIQPAIKLVPKNQLAKIICIPALVIAVFAVFQTLWLPAQFFAAVGYSDSTIAPLQFIDSASNIKRAFATLGGPNQLGAYLIIPISFATILLIRYRRWRYGAVLAVLLAGLLVSFSRSAWLGGIAVLGLSLLSILPLWLQIGLPVSLVTMVLIFWNNILSSLQNSTNKYLQYIVLHGRFFSEKNIGSPDSFRQMHLFEQLKLIGREPFGHGLGSAGPASKLGSNPVIAESWYVQIAHEIGVLGLAGYLALLILGLWKLFSSPSSVLRDSVLVMMAGLIVVNLFIHGLADSTLSYMAAVLVGLAIGESYAYRARS